MNDCVEIRQIGHADDVESFLNCNPSPIVIGEYVSEDGPFAEDHFLVFVFDVNSIYIVGVATALSWGVQEKMEKYLGFSVLIHLSSVTSFSTVVHYPESINGEELLEIRNSYNKSFFGKKKQSFLSLTPRVKSVLRGET